MVLPIHRINALSELELLDIAYVDGGEDEIRIICPFHKDSTPSCCVNTKSNLFICQASSCNAKGDIINLIAHVLQTSRRVAVAELSDRYDLEEKKVLNPKDVERYHKELLGTKALLSELYKRGITDSTIRERRLGCDKGRITIPIYEGGEIVNIRRYMPGAPGHLKFKNTKGHGKRPRLYPGIEQLDYGIVWIDGGELKGAVAAQILNPHNIGGVSASGGEGSWVRAWDSKFEGKTVYICMDVDAAGRKAANKIATYLYGKAKVYLIALPLDKEKYPKGDTNDWVGLENAVFADFKLAMDNAKAYEPDILEERLDEEIPATEVKFLDAIRLNRSRELLSFSALPVAVDETPYTIPKTVGVNCDRAQNCCHQCAIYGTPIDADNAYAEVHLPGTSEHLVAMVGVPTNKLRDALFDIIAIPHACKVVRFKISKTQVLYDTRISPVLDFQKDVETTVQQAFVLSERVDINTPYKMQGVLHANPKNQRSVFVVRDIEPEEDTLTEYNPDKHELDKLKIFQPKEWTVESIDAKLDELYDDLETHVTRIYERRDIHKLIDVVFHSALNFNYDGRTQNGWIGALLIGDSSLGKSEASSRLHEFYNLGARLDCRSASYAGIVGGLQQFDGGQYYVSWGSFVQYDRQSLILDEFKGLHTDIIGKLTDLRSSGWAEIPKIEHRKAPARTRLLAITNPRYGDMADYAYGIRSIEKLTGSPEATRRFDLVGVFAKDEDIDIFREDRKKADHTHTSELCRSLILFAWTRAAHQINIQNVKKAQDLSKELRSRYSEKIPVVDSGSIHLKLLRVSVAFALRTFSVDDKYIVQVRDCHIQYAFDFMDSLYSSDACGYSAYSESVRRNESISHPDKVVKYLCNVNNISKLVEGCLVSEEICREDIEDWCEMEQQAAKVLISFLVRHRCFTRNDRWTYKKTPPFVAFLRKMQPELKEITPNLPEL
jgi:hypothetical protein